MRERVLGTLTIRQAPRPDVVPIIDRYVSAEVRRIHRGVLDGLSHAEIAARYQPEGGEPELVTGCRMGLRSCCRGSA
jgi:protein AroM